MSARRASEARHRVRLYPRTRHRFATIMLPKRANERPAVEPPNLAKLGVVWVCHQSGLKYVRVLKPGDAFAGLFHHFFRRLILMTHEDAGDKCPSSPVGLRSCERRISR
jgi:hypothetical protein